VRTVAAATANKWDLQALRREQLADDDIGLLLREVEAGQSPSGGISMTTAHIYISHMYSAMGGGATLENKLRSVQ